MDICINPNTSRKPRDDRRHFFIFQNTEVIGKLNSKHIDHENHQCELSIHLQNDSVKGRGYGTIAERLALEYTFEQLNHETVLVDSMQKNKRSQHVLEKIGFTLTGEDDTFRYYRMD